MKTELNRNDLINKWIKEINEELAFAWKLANTKRAKWLESLRAQLVRIRDGVS